MHELERLYHIHCAKGRTCCKPLTNVVLLAFVMVS